MDLEKINRYCTRITKQRQINVSLDASDFVAFCKIADHLKVHQASLTRGLILSFIEEYQNSPPSGEDK